MRRISIILTSRGWDLFSRICPTTSIMQQVSQRFKSHTPNNRWIFQLSSSASGLRQSEKSNPTLIDNVRKHLEKSACKRRLIRQSEVEWNHDCDAVFAYFEEVSQFIMSTLKMLIQDISASATKD